jgi:hypothetical protein
MKTREKLSIWSALCLGTVIIPLANFIVSLGFLIIRSQPINWLALVKELLEQSIIGLIIVLCALVIVVGATSVYRYFDSK